MDSKKCEDYELVECYFEEVVFFSPALAVCEAVFVEVVVDDVAVALQQNNSYKEQDYAKHHASTHTFRL